MQISMQTVETQPEEGGGSKSSSTAWCQLGQSGIGASNNGGRKSVLLRWNISR